jgi:hypothetical protein
VDLQAAGGGCIGGGEGKREGRTGAERHGVSMKLRLVALAH